MYQDTVLKGTFNATLNNPLVIKSERGASESSRLANIHHGSTLRHNNVSLGSLPEHQQQQTLKI